MIASLLGEPYYLRLDDVAGLTDRQLHELYFHSRYDDGSLVVAADPDAPARVLTPDEEDGMMESMALALGASQEKVDALKAKAHERRATQRP